MKDKIIMRAVIVLFSLGWILPFVLAFCVGGFWPLSPCCESRPVCSKSGGVCDCRYCNCESTCPGQCAQPCCEVGK